MQATAYEEAITSIVKTPDMIEAEMESPMNANFAQFNYQMPNGVKCGVGKSRRPGHASLFQIIVIDFDGKPAFKFEKEYSDFLQWSHFSRNARHLEII